MKRANLLACDVGSTFLATAVGPSVLVYSGEDEQPLWRGKCAGNVIGLGVTDEEVITLDDSGATTWWSGESGKKTDSVAVTGAVRALAVDADGVAAVLTKDGVEILDPGSEPVRLKLREGRCLAWSEDGTRLAVGQKSGRVTVFDADAAEELGSVELEAAVTSLAWNAEGEWVATAGSTLYSVTEAGDDSDELETLRDATPDCVTCSADGGLLAVRVGASEVRAFTYPELEPAGRVTTRARTVHGLSFGAKAWLAIGLDLGDANKVSMRTGAVRRTEPHGDETRTWEVDVEVNKSERRKGGVPEARRAAGPARPRGPRTERELNTPDVQTLVLLGAVAASTVIMWGAGKFYCNDSSPISKSPREVGTVELSGTPKDAAIEMVHRLATYQFDKALELTEGEPSRQVEEAMRECEKGGQQACEARRKESVGKVLTTAELLTQTPAVAKARVTSIVKGGATTVYDVELKQSAPIWKVVKLEKRG